MSQVTTPVSYGSIPCRRIERRISRSRHSRQSHARAAARLSIIVTPVPRSHSLTGRPLSPDRARLSGLWAQRRAGSRCVSVHLRPSGAGHRPIPCHQGLRSVRTVCAGLRRPGWFPPVDRNPDARMAHHPELKRLRVGFTAAWDGLLQRALENAPPATEEPLLVLTRDTIKTIYSMARTGPSS